MIFERNTKDITGVILAGGKSKRMGRDKATLKIGHSYLIEFPLNVLKRHFKHILVVTSKKLLQPLKTILSSDINVVSDIYPAHGALGGIYTALHNVQSTYIFVTACDMPFINDGFVEFMLKLINGHDIIIPKGSKGYETLHAIYKKTLRETIKENILRTQNKIIDFFPKADVLTIPIDEIKKYGVEEKMFRNINTKQELTESF